MHYFSHTFKAHVGLITPDDLAYGAFQNSRSKSEAFDQLKAHPISSGITFRELEEIIRRNYQ